jgi:hypothetical protein
MVFTEISVHSYGQFRWEAILYFCSAFLLVISFFFSRQVGKNPNGQPTCNCFSADFPPTRAGVFSGNFDKQIATNLLFFFS